MGNSVRGSTAHSGLFANVNERGAERELRRPAATFQLPHFQIKLQTFFALVNS